jgi:GNAT superfamily N-acetyltransferase
MTCVNLDEAAAAYARRLTSSDPLLPVLAVPQLAQGNELIGASDAESVAVGVARFNELDPASLLATWGALHQHELVVRLSGPTPEPALDRLLSEWDRHIAARATPGDDETAAMIMWPSRDTAPVRALTRHGFAPLVVLAARRSGLAVPAFGTGVRIRPGTAADLDVLADLNLAVVDFDVQFGVVTRRPSTRDMLRASYVEALDRADPGIWLAERAGQPIGMIAIDLPPHANWVSGLTCAAPVGYVGCIYVRDEARGGGVGSALVAEAHRALESAGVAVTLLHHSLSNPRSTPFWYSHGYRPLWTVWQRRPAVAADPGVS